MEANRISPECKTANMRVADQHIPPLCQAWNRLSDALPAWTIGNRLPVQLTVLTMVVLTGLRLVLEWVQVHVWGWPTHGDAQYNLTTWAAAAGVAIVHSTTLVPGLITCLAGWAHPRYDPSARIQHAPWWWRTSVDAMLQFCTGYMIYDGMVNIVIGRFGIMTGADWMFLAHHVATTFYMTTCRLYGAGHQSAMMCMLLGECTNPFHNAYYIAEAAMQLSCCNGAAMHAFYKMDAVLFASSYCLVRVFVGPVLLAHTTFVLWARPTVPFWVRAVWTALIWGVVIGSWPWIVDCWHMLRPYWGMVVALRAGSEL